MSTKFNISVLNTYLVDICGGLLRAQKGGSQWEVRSNGLCINEFKDKIGRGGEILP